MKKEGVAVFTLPLDDVDDQQHKGDEEDEGDEEECLNLRAAV